jgi:3-deoxy-D-manno-octulosonic acid kinase
MMTKDGVRRIATSGGAVLADSASLTRVAHIGAAELGAVTPEKLFDPGFWAARGELVEVTGGRGSAWFVAAGGAWVLRHSRRGGFIARLSQDGYFWAGESAVRSFAEFRLLAELVSRGLPVPAPIAARYVRRGLLYRCDLITERIPGARPLGAVLALAALDERGWRDVGTALARLHAAGADHADLNAHNILLDGAGRVSVIDFDRGKLRKPSSPRHPAGWATRNLSRLQRSLTKISHRLPPERCSAAAWQWLLAGYSEARPQAPG